MKLKEFFKGLFSKMFNKNSDNYENLTETKIDDLDLFEEDEVGAYCFFAGKC